MREKRPIGIKLIVAYLCLKAGALVAAFAVTQTRPELRTDAEKFILYFAINFGSPLRLPSAIITGTLDVVLGLGIWFLQRWSRTIIVMSSSYGLCRMAVGSVILWELDRKFLLSQTSSPYFAVGVVSEVFILFYLLDPDVKQLFGEQE